MREFYRSELGVLYCGDSLEFLKEGGKEFDLLLTDPPYGIEKVEGTLAKERKHKHTYDSFDDSVEYYRDVVVPIIEGSLRVCSRAIITPGTRNFSLLP